MPDNTEQCQLQTTLYSKQNSTCVKESVVLVSSHEPQDNNRCSGREGTSILFRIQEVQQNLASLTKRATIEKVERF